MIVSWTVSTAAPISARVVNAHSIPDTSIVCQRTTDPEYLRKHLIEVKLARRSYCDNQLGAVDGSSMKLVSKNSAR